MNVCIFCGSSLGGNPIFRKTAEELGEGLAETGLTLVYGGGNVGLMGVLADAVIRRGEMSISLIICWLR